MSGDIREQGTVIAALGAKGVGPEADRRRDGGWSSPRGRSISGHHGFLAHCRAQSPE
jgi:hypothetical protein